MRWGIFNDTDANSAVFQIILSIYNRVFPRESEERLTYPIERLIGDIRYYGSDLHYSLFYNYFVEKTASTSISDKIEITKIISTIGKLAKAILDIVGYEEMNGLINDMIEDSKVGKEEKLYENLSLKNLADRFMKIDEMYYADIKAYYMIQKLANSTQQLIGEGASVDVFNKLAEDYEKLCEEASRTSYETVIKDVENYIHQKHNMNLLTFIEMYQEFD